MYQFRPTVDPISVSHEAAEFLLVLYFSKSYVTHEIVYRRNSVLFIDALLVRLEALCQNCGMQLSS